MERPVDGDTEPFWSEPSRRPPDERASVDGLTVLAVDDEPEILSLYVAWFASQHTVRIAVSVQGALDQLTADIDVVVVDRNLPDGQGDDILRSLASEGSEQRARAVIVSAREPDLDVASLPFDAYLTKPVDRESLSAVVEWAYRHNSRPPAAAEYLVLDHRVRLLEASAVTVELQSSPAFSRLRRRRDDAKRRMVTQAEATTCDQTGEAAPSQSVRE